VAHRNQEADRALTSIRLKYVQAFVDRKTGAVFRYFRRPGYPRVRLPGLPGSAEFNRAYEEALHGPALVIGAKRTKPGSLHAAVAGYFTSLEFRTLKPGTQGQRRAILLRFDAAHGDKPIALLPPPFIRHMLVGMKPFQARNWLKAIRGLMVFCVTEKFIAADPTRDIKLAEAKSAGFHTWTEDEIATFEAHHPVGGRARLALALLLYTAQRRGDVIRMGRQHIRDGVLHVKQKKTGVELDIPVHSELRAIIDATPSQHLTFIVGERGKPMTPTFFSRWFRSQCDAAGLPRCCTGHGLRKAACRRLAEAGCSVNEISAISGHKTLKEIERYTKAADQARMARNAMARTEPETPTVKIADV
jgi:integrase